MKMKVVPIVAVLLIMLAQTMTFILLWNLIVTIARSHGRFPREIFFGITISYGAIWIICLFVACGLVAFLTSKPQLKWTAIFAGLLAWLAWLWPSFESRPYALPAFFALGATILVTGTGFGIPYFRRLATRISAKETNGDQNITSNS